MNQNIRTTQSIVISAIYWPSVKSQNFGHLIDFRGPDASGVVPHTIWVLSFDEKVLRKI